MSIDGDLEMSKTKSASRRFRRWVANLVLSDKIDVDYYALETSKRPFVWFVPMITVVHIVTFVAEHLVAKSPKFSTILDFKPYLSWEEPWRYLSYCLVNEGIPQLCINIICQIFAR